MLTRLKQFSTYLFGMAFYPRRTTERWLNDGFRLRWAIVAWIIISGLYGLATYIGGLNGLGAVTTPFIAISAKDYYLWIGPLTPFIFLIVFILLAGMIQLGSKIFGGQGTFEDTFVSVIFSFWMPTLLILWLFEMPVLVFFPGWRRSNLGGLGYIPLWLDTIRQIAGMIWIIVTLIISIQVVQKLSLPKAILIIILGFIPTTAVILTYIR